MIKSRRSLLCHACCCVLCCTLFAALLSADPVSGEIAAAAAAPAAEAEEEPAAAADEASAEDAAEESAAVLPGTVDEYTGWEYTPVSKYDETRSCVRLTLNGKRGAFGLYAVSPRGKRIPLLSRYDGFSRSYFTLRVGRKDYKLKYSGGVNCQARKTVSGGQLAYTIPKKAYFVADFSFPETNTTEVSNDVLRVTLYTVNLGKTPQVFSVKGIFDTILGETSGKHFFTDTKEVIKTQMQFPDMAEDKWVCSADNKAAIEFLMLGGDITKPQYVTLSTMDALEASWVPAALQSKSFISSRSYNDSGVAINWNPLYLDPQQMGVITFYISIAEGVVPIYAGRKPANKEFLDAMESGNYTYHSSSDPAVRDAESAAGEGGEPSVTPVAAPVDTVVHEAVSHELSPAAQAVTEEQLDPEYIQNLIDYIESIQSGEDIDEEELRSLNEELDAIFEKLRSMGN